jgi:hypothetical protein
MKVGDIVKRVREYLDEVNALNNVEVLNGSAPVDERIMSLIPECAVVFGQGKAMDVSSFVVGNGGVGLIDVPADYGRLQELRLSCWSRSVYEVVLPGTPQYRRQQNLVTRGGTVRPVVALVPKGEGRVLESYSVPTWDSRVKVDEASYVAVPVIEDRDTDIAVSSDKESAMCYMIAVRVARTYGDETSATLLSSTLNEEMSIKSVM